VRYQHASDIHADLKRLKRDTDSSRVAPGFSPPSRDAALKGGATGDSPDFQMIAGLIQRHKNAAIGTVVVVLVLAVVTWYLLRRPPQPSAELTQNRLTFNSSENAVRSDAISPNGKYLAYSDPGGIHVKLLSTGEERLIPRPAGVPSGAFWDVDSWFPDSTQTLADADEPGGRESMWIASILGDSPRELRESAWGGEASPDGTRIVFTPRSRREGPLALSGNAREIWVMGSQGDNPQKVLEVGEHESLTWVRWSADGQRLGYIRVRDTQGGPQTSIETCDMNGANRTVVMSDPELSLEDFYWLPDQRIVYSRQESPGSTDENLWQIGIDTHTGAPTGKPKRITQWPGSYLWGLGASADGRRSVLQKAAAQGQVYVGELGAGGTRMSPPRRLTNDEAFDQPTAWTPDSKAVLFGSNRNGQQSIFRQAINQNTAEPVVTGPQNAGIPRLSADGDWILSVERPKTAVGPPFPGRLMRIPVSGGVPQFVMDWRPNYLDFGCARAPASLCAVWERSQDQQQLVIAAFDPLKGRGKVLRTIDADPTAFYDNGLSPDGATFAVSRGGEAEIHVRLLSLSGGSDREITVKGWSNITGLDWSPDGKGLYCGSVSPQGSTLLYVDPKGNARALWQSKAASPAIWGVPSPDGHYLAIPGIVINSNVWMLEGF